MKVTATKEITSPKEYSFFEMERREGVYEHKRISSKKPTFLSFRRTVYIQEDGIIELASKNLWSMGGDSFIKSNRKITFSND